MKIQSLLKRGYSHAIYGEDALFHTTINNKWNIGAIMDGCSSARESCFAATLLSKLVAKGCKLLPIIEKIQPELTLDKMTPQMVGEFILSQVFSDIISTQKRLLLENIEILSTLSLLVYNEITKEVYINISGDGFYAINNKLSEVDQNNTPDFLGYHTNKSFEVWLHNHTKIIQQQNVNSVSIATDGISKLYSEDGKKHSSINPQEYLIIPQEKKDKKLSLDARYNILSKNFNLIPFDDIAIIQFVE